MIELVREPQANAEANWRYAAKKRAPCTNNTRARVVRRALVFHEQWHCDVAARARTAKVPVLRLQYEQMLTAPADALRRVLAFGNYSVSDAGVERAEKVLR